MDGNFIKINRKILEWEWYSDINTCRVFIHMLLRANWKDGNFKGIFVPRGSFISSIDKISLETGLTLREVRTALSHLKKTGEVTSKSTNKFTVFMLANYCKYQAFDEQNDKQKTNERQTNDKQETNERHSNDILTTTIEERKERKEEKEYIKERGACTSSCYFENKEMNQAFELYILSRSQQEGRLEEAEIKKLQEELIGVSDKTSVRLAAVKKATLNNSKTFQSAPKKETIRKKFIPPALEEVEAYCLERKNGINAESFLDFYASKDWFVGKNKMADWRAAVRTWERRTENDTPARIEQNASGEEKYSQTGNDIVTKILRKQGEN